MRLEIPHDKPLKIGELASAVPVGIDTVRYYERQGLLPTPQRRASGYRTYDHRDVERLRFVRRAKDLGFSLEEIRELLRLSEDRHADRAEVRTIASHRLADVEARLRELERMRTVLATLVQTCSGHGAVAGCPIIEAVLGHDTESNEPHAP